MQYLNICKEMQQTRLLKLQLHWTIIANYNIWQHTPYFDFTRTKIK